MRSTPQASTSTGIAPERLHGVGVEDDAAVAAQGTRSPRPAAAFRSRCWRPSPTRGPSRAAARRRRASTSTTPSRATSTRVTAKPFALERPAGLQHRRVLDHGRDDVAALRAGRPRDAAHGEVVGLGRAGGEDDVGRQRRRSARPRARARPRRPRGGLLAERVLAAGGVAEPLREVRQHGRRAPPGRPGWSRGGRGRSPEVHSSGHPPSPGVIESRREVPHAPFHRPGRHRRALRRRCGRPW